MGTFKTAITWRRTLRPVTTKDLTILTVGILCCLIGNSAAVPVDTELLSSEPEGASNSDENICWTKECNETATTFLNNMDRSVDPCDNFYKFACGGFINSTIIPADQTSVSAISLLQDKVYEQLKTIIEVPIQPNEAKPFLLAKNFYNACMNVAAIEEQGLQPLHNILTKLGGWPVVNGDNWNETEFDWKTTIYKFRKIGYPISYFIGFGIGNDLKNNTKYIIDIDQASLGLPQEYLSRGFNDTIVQAYYSYMVDIAVILGADKDRAMIELKESLLFEINLANISLPKEKRRDSTKLYNPMTLTELTKNYPSVPWREYFSKLLPPSITIEENEVVIVEVPSYISDLEKLMATTPKRVQANYVMWRATAGSVSFLNEDIRKRELAYGTALTGRTEREARWKECVDGVSEGLSISVGAMYVRKYFDEEAKKNAVDMVMDIRRQFNNSVHQVEWMDEKTRQSALEKAAAMASYIAYPDELLDDSKIERFYKNLDLSGGNYLESILNLTLFLTENSYGKLRKPVNKTDWVRHGSSAIVNAFYSPTENSIQFPAGILHGTFFSNSRPRYMNYGSIGFVIGHEITHGFDDQGRQFDKDGNLIDWWAPTTEENYLKRAECIINQYGNFTAEEVGLKLNGINTQGENIADNGGIKEAYLAYNDWVARNSPEKKLPGLPYTPKQTFWISAANTWCSKYRPEALNIVITTGVHSPGEFRVLGPLSNIPAFSEDFNCPIGSKMNPERKCSVW